MLHLFGGFSPFAFEGLGLSGVTCSELRALGSKKPETPIDVYEKPRAQKPMLPYATSLQS